MLLRSPEVSGGFRSSVLLALAAVVLSIAAPVHSATRENEGLLFYPPRTGVAGDRTVLRWRAAGQPFAPNTRITVQQLSAGTWRPISPPVPANQRSYTWDTTAVAPDSGTWVRLRLVGSGGLRTPSARLWVDHTPPAVSLASPKALPAPGGQPRVAVVRGPVELAAVVDDFPFHAADVRWRMKRGPVTITGHYPSPYTFPPGVTELTAVATDLGGNVGLSQTITVIALPSE